MNVRSDIADAWSNYEVLGRRHSLFSGISISQQFAMGATLTEPEKDSLNKHIAERRSRLTDISWFMRVINEPIALQANAEDKCTGRFWGDRFESQALLDDKVLLSCIAYVDLNPVRVGIATTPESSEFPCVAQRITDVKPNTSPPSSIEQFIGSLEEEIGLPFVLADYLELIDWTGRILRDDTQGAINNKLPPILERLSFERKAWKELSKSFESNFNQRL